MKIETPFPPESTVTLWGWLHQHPDASFDDQGPRTLEEFSRAMVARRAAGERSWGFRDDRGRLCGFVGYRELWRKAGMLHGVCFARGYLDKSEKRWLVRKVLEELFGLGVEKVGAEFFADNLHIRKFLEDLGFKKEGVLVAQTTRRGLPLDHVLMAAFKEDTCRSAVC